MYFIKDGDLYNIKGGTSSLGSPTLWNSISRVITTILDLGKTIGSFIYRYQHKDYCN